MLTTTLKLWFVQETLKARQYLKIPSSRSPTAGDMVWIPKCVIEGTTKYPPKDKEYPVHLVKLPDWFIEKNNL